MALSRKYIIFLLKPIFRDSHHKIKKGEHGMKRHLYSAFAVFLLILCGTFQIQAEALFESDLLSGKALDGFSSNSSISLKPDGLCGDFTKRVAYETVNLSLDPAKFSGRLIRISCEARAENILPRSKPFEGIKLMLSMQNDKKKSWGGIDFPTGDFEWKKFENTIAVPADLKSISLSIGMQNSAGKFQIRNLKIENAGIAVQIRSVANMSLADEVAGDNQGGWTDQGPKQDGRSFFGHLYRKEFAGIPIDAEPEGKGVLTMHSKYFTAGPEEVVIPLNPAAKAKSLYILHTAAWGPQLKGKSIGSVTLKDRNSVTQEIPVVYNHDVADWYRNIAVLDNGYCVLRGRTGDDNLAGVYLSRFDVKPELEEITEISFRSNPESLWLILGASLSPENIPLPANVSSRIQASDEWLPISRPSKNMIEPGSALDLSTYMRQGSVDELGRVIIKDGHFVFEKNPAQRVRFLADALTPHVDLMKLSHEEIEALAAEMRRNGYNMLRTHFLDQGLMGGASEDLEFNKEMLDRIDYLIFCMKKNGIYWNFDCMTSWIGYTPGNPMKKNDPKTGFKARIYYDSEVRRNWRGGVEKFLCHVNPYTGKRLVDDPVLVMAVAFNEQEFGFWRDFDTAWFLPRWREFLKKKYGTVENLHKAWQKDSAKFKSFDEIPCMTGYDRNYSNVDAAEFLAPIEEEMLNWYETQMKEIGFKGYLVNYNCGKSQFFNYLRKDSPLVAMNHYHAHPSNWISKHSFISQKSAIGTGAQVFRNFMGTRLFGKPFVITEHNFVFWNRYRYEQGFVIGGYSAFQDFDALTCHGSPVSLRPVNDIQSFGIWMDPIAKASEFLTFFLFIRGDLSPAAQSIRIRAQKSDCFSESAVAGGLSSEQSFPSLLTGLSIECTENLKDQLPLRPGEIAYKLGATNSVLVNNAGYSSTSDNPVANISEILLHLRKASILKPDNRSDGKNVFETSNSEILLDKSKNFMQINTPRFQGICAMKGTSAQLSEFGVIKMSRDGNLALVSIDAMKGIAESGKMMLVYATNALNSDMEFTSDDMISLLNCGHGPTLIEQGAFTVSVKNKNAEKLKMYPLDIGGKRLKVISPDSVKDNVAVFSADTGKDGAAIYFEISSGEDLK